MVCQLSMVLMDGHGAALMPSQAHAKPNEEGMLGAFVTPGGKKLKWKFTAVTEEVTIVTG